MIKFGIALFLAAVSSQAQAVTCEKRDVLVRLLEEQYQEFSVETGLANGNRLIELFASAQGETWTLVAIDPHGMACVIAVGNNWQTIGLPPDEA